LRWGTMEQAQGMFAVITTDLAELVKDATLLLF
jgi:hypothetical protein